jgi:hypothetical protein
LSNERDTWLSNAYEIRGTENQTGVWLTKIAAKIPKTFGLASFVVTLDWLDPKIISL